MPTDDAARRFYRRVARGLKKKQTSALSPVMRQDAKKLALMLDEDFKTLLNLKPRSRMMRAVNKKRSDREWFGKDEDA